MTKLMMSTMANAGSMEHAVLNAMRTMQVSREQTLRR